MYRSTLCDYSQVVTKLIFDGGLSPSVGKPKLCTSAGPFARGRRLSTKTDCAKDYSRGLPVTLQTQRVIPPERPVRNSSARAADA